LSLNRNLSTKNYKNRNHNRSNNSYNIRENEIRDKINNQDCFGQVVRTNCRCLYCGNIGTRYGISYRGTDCRKFGIVWEAGCICSKCFQIDSSFMDNSDLLTTDEVLDNINNNANLSPEEISSIIDNYNLETIQRNWCNNRLADLIKSFGLARKPP
jgi:hypothetical protein